MTTRTRTMAAVLAGIVASQGPTVPAARAQSVDLGDILGALVQGAVEADTMSRRPRRRPPVQTAAVDPIRDSRAYTIDGRGLGDRAGRISDDFACKASEQFPGFTWCRSRRPVAGVFTATSILLGSGGIIQYYNKFYESADFSPDAIGSEIARLSGLYHERPRILRMPRGTVDSEAVIAVWGDMLLKSVDAATMQQLMTGQSVTSGIMVDFLGNVRDSARAGLPVFRISGGPGYYWAARLDARGHGNLRFGMANAAVYDNFAPPPAPDVPSPAMASGPDADKQAADAAAAAEIARRAAEERANLAKQQEEARRAKLAEEQAARDAAAARLKADRLASATAAAKRKLDEASGFVQANRDAPQLMTHLEHITALTTALNASSPEPDAIEQKTNVLSAGLSADAAYSAFAARRDAEQQREVARDLADATRDLQLKKGFLIEAVARDPVGAMAPDLLALAKQIDATVAASDLGRSQTLVGTIDAAIGKAGLSDSFKLVKQNAGQSRTAGITVDSAAAIKPAADSASKP